MHYFPESLIKRFETLMTSEPELEHVFNVTLDPVKWSPERSCSYFSHILSAVMEILNLLPSLTKNGSR